MIMTANSSALSKALLLILAHLVLFPAAHGQKAAAANPNLTNAIIGLTINDGPQGYRLSPNDVVRVRVFQEDDLATEMRLSKDGSATFPLLGVISLAGKTVEEAAASIRDALGKDFLVNPQVTLTVVEYAKRRFTVLGQVQKPGSYEFPEEESVTLLQAIAMAGGFTRLAVQGKVTITRTTGGKKMITVDVRSAANDPGMKPFEIMPDDTIIISERLF